MITKSCIDIDGVLCVDPSDSENDDGENYQNFLLNAKPLFLPSYFIPCLVTSRLEKYRTETEAWLLKHKIDYGDLIMLDLPSAEKRRELGIHARFKADVFAIREEEYFIESSWVQAKDIFTLTNKFVFCTENDVFIKTYTDIVFYDNALKYSDGHFKDIFSDTSEIGLKFQQLKMEYDAIELNNRKLHSKILRIENNKWFKFSNLNHKQKFLFVFKLFFSRLWMVF